MQTEVHIVICITMKLIKQNMAFNTQTNHNCHSLNHCRPSLYRLHVKYIILNQYLCLLVNMADILPLIMTVAPGTIADHLYTK